MLMIVNQCKTGVFDAKYFIGAWVKDYGNNTFMLKARFSDKEVILGIFKTEDRAKDELSNLISLLKIHNLINKNKYTLVDIYQIHKDGD